MRILYVLPFIPWPVRVRTYNLLPRLARSHEIHVVCVSTATPSEQQTKFLESCCRTVSYVPHGHMQAVLQCTAALTTRTPMRMAYCKSRLACSAVRKLMHQIKPDVIYVERWRPLQYLPERNDIPVVCDATDSMTLYNGRLRREGAWWERVVGSVEHRRFLEYEGMLARRADVSVFCSSLDLECVVKQAPEIRCEVVPNGVDCSKYFFKDESEEESGTLVFAGNFKYRPNYHAMNYFLEEIYPQIQRVAPETKLVAVGNGAENVLARQRKKTALRAVGYVPDLRPYLATASVAIAPLTVGAGVTNKLAEAFAVGTALVATPLACGDLPVNNGEHLLIGRDSKEFAAGVVRLLQDKKLRRQMAVCSRRFVEKYDWEIVAKAMERVLEETVERKAGKRPSVSVAFA